MDAELGQSLLKAIENLQGFDARFEEHSRALQTNKIALEALIPAVLSLNVQMMNAMASIMQTQMVLLKPSDRQMITRLANSMEKQSEAMDEFTAASDRFTKALNSLAAKM